MRIFPGQNTVFRKGASAVILIIDFGSQYNQFIARRVREHQVYCQIEPPDIGLEKIRALNPRGSSFPAAPPASTKSAAPGG